jgi:tryptophanyl-tRNA synthetase
VIEFVTPYRERTNAFLDDVPGLDAILARGAEKARSVAAETLAEVYDRIGFVPAKH